MREGDGGTLGEAIADDSLQGLRVRVLETALRLVALAVPAIGVVILVSEVRRGELDTTTIALSAYTLTFPVLHLARRRLGFRRAAVAFVGLLVLTAFLVEWQGGVGVGSVSVNVLVLLLSALFFGRRGAAVALGLVLVLLAAAGFVVVTTADGVAHGMLWDPTRPEFWVRQLVALALFGATFVGTQIYVVERLALEAGRLRSLAEREQKQRIALEQAEQEREQEREQRLLTLRALEESRRVEALARLAGGIAHDFNNALTVILGTAETIGFSRSLEEAKSGAAQIIEASRRSAELTQKLLALGRRQVSRPRAVSIGTQLEQLRGTLRRVLPSSVTLSMSLPAEKLVARLDPTELERAIVNLAFNARDAMPRGGALSITCRQVKRAPAASGRAGDYAEITVSDTGQGMTDETLAHIFEPFYTTKSPGEGTGLGLATVQAFARDSEGEVSVKSTPGAGTTFTLLLPLVDGEDLALAPGEKPLVPQAGNGLRVLVVEDRADVQASMVKTLEEGGFTVTAASDGDAALAALVEQPGFAVLCIDGMMPGTATGEVIETARKGDPSLRVLLCSGYLPEDLLRRDVAMGRYAFLQKPFSGKELLAAVHALFEPAKESPRAAV